MAKVSCIGICGQSTFLSVDHFHKTGETIFTKEIFEEIGGKGINQAVAAARMDVDVSFLGAIGNDQNGLLCKKLLKKENIKDCLVVKEGIPTTFAFILVDKKGENQVTGFHGAELTRQDVLDFSEEIKTSDVLLLQQEVPSEVNELAISIANQNNIPVILNPAPEGLSPDFKGKLFAATPNEHESRFVDFNKFEHTAVSLGKDGCLLDGKTKIPALKVTAVDTTGAGDTFNGVMSAMIAKKSDFDNACRYAVVASSMSVTKKYVIDSIPTIKDIERVMNDERLWIL